MKRRKRMREREIRIPIHRVNDELINKSRREGEGGIREMMMLMMISWRIGPLLLRSARRRFRRVGRQAAHRRRPSGHSPSLNAC